MGSLPGLKQRARGDHSSRTVTCPRCDSDMMAAVREPLPSQRKVRPESASIHVVRLAVWRCLTCGVERPRFS